MRQYNYHYCDKCKIYRLTGSKTKPTNPCGCKGIVKHSTEYLNIGIKNKTHIDTSTYIKALQANCSKCGTKPSKRFVYSTLLGSEDKPQYMRAIDVNNISYCGETLCDKCYNAEKDAIRLNLELLHYTNIVFAKWSELGTHAIVKQKPEGKDYFFVYAKAKAKGVRLLKYKFPLMFYTDYFKYAQEE